MLPRGLTVHQKLVTGTEEVKEREFCKSREQHGWEVSLRIVAIAPVQSRAMR